MTVSQAPVLVNCSHKPQFVMEGDRLIMLRSAPEPTAVEMSGDTQRGSLMVTVGESLCEVALGLEVLEAPFAQGPPEIDATLWLVDGPTMNVFAHRDDFVRPAWYKMVNLADLDVSGVDPVILADAAMCGRLFVLGGVSRSRVVVPAGAQRLSELLFDEPGSGDEPGDTPNGVDELGDTGVGAGH